MPTSTATPLRLRREFLNSWLLLLVRLSPTHGYHLHDRLRQLGFHATTSSVYRGLRALEAEGLVRSEWKASSEGAAQRVYKITPKGRRNLKKSVQNFADARDSFGLFVKEFERGTASRRKRS